MESMDRRRNPKKNLLQFQGLVLSKFKRSLDTNKKIIHLLRVTIVFYQVLAKETKMNPAILSLIKIEETTVARS